MNEIRLRVNGTVHAVRVDDEKMPLLYALRDDLGMHDPRFGCGLVDGEATRSCVRPVAELGGREVTTLEGLGTPEHPHPLQGTVEANVIQPVSRSLYEQVTFDDHSVTSVDWHTYPVLRMREVPEVVVVSLHRPNLPPGGAGEPRVAS